MSQLVKVVSDTFPQPTTLFQAKTRGLPDDHSGPVRVVEISGGLDSNLCCGTHLNNLAQLQVVKLLNVENSKRSELKKYP